MVCPQNRTAVLKGLIDVGCRVDTSYLVYICYIGARYALVIVLSVLRSQRLCLLDPLGGGGQRVRHT